MWECMYSKEPVDFRLMGLRLLKRIWILPVSMVAGCLLVGIVYYMSRLCFGNTRTYQTETLYYIEFGEDSSGKSYDYVNHYTWGEIVTTDFFVDYIYNELGGNVTKEEIKESVIATVESDVRYLYTRSTNKSPELSERIEEAVRKAIPAFADTKREFLSIEMIRHDEKCKDVSNIRLKTAGVLGALLGLFVSLLVFVLRVITDTSIYIPSTLEKRYKRPTLLASSMEEYEANCRLLLEKYDKVTVVPSDEATDARNIELYREFTYAENPCTSKEAILSLKDAECVVVAVKAGSDNGKRLERTLEELGRIGANVAAFALINEDNKLINRYYRK